MSLDNKAILGNLREELQKTFPEYKVGEVERTVYIGSVQYEFNLPGTPIGYHLNIVKKINSFRDLLAVMGMWLKNMMFPLKLKENLDFALRLPEVTASLHDKLSGYKLFIEHQGNSELERRIEEFMKSLSIERRDPNYSSSYIEDGSFITSR